MDSAIPFTLNPTEKIEPLHWKPIEAGVVTLTGILSGEFYHDHSVVNKEYFRFFLVFNQKDKIPIIIESSSLEQTKKLIGKSVTVSGEVHTKREDLYLLNPSITKKKTSSSDKNTITAEGFCLFKTEPLPWHMRGYGMQTSPKTFLLKIPHISGVPDILPCELAETVPRSKIKRDKCIKITGHFETRDDNLVVVVDKCK